MTSIQSFTGQVPQPVQMQKSQFTSGVNFKANMVDSFERQSSSGLLCPKYFLGILEFSLNSILPPTIFF